MHPYRVIAPVDNAILPYGLKKARPATGARKFGVASEQHIAAYRAILGPLCVLIPVLPGKRLFSSALPRGSI